MKRYAWLALLILGICIRFAPVFAGRTLVFGDNISLLVPVKLYSAYWLKHGIIPWWNPTIFAGVPWAEDISQSFFYPSTILFAFLDPALALSVTVMLHLFFTGAGMYLLAKKLFHNEFGAILSSMLWTFSPQVTYTINNLSTIQSIAWFPWVVLSSVHLKSKKYGMLLFALVVGGQFLAGYPQHVLYSILTAALLDLYLTTKNKNFQIWPWLSDWVKTAVVVVGITAVAWFPFARVLGESTRSVQNPTQAMSGSLNPRQLPKIIVPYIFDLPLAGFRWGPAYSDFVQTLTYYGLVGLIALALFLKRNFYWLGVFGGLLLFSMGSHFPGFETLYSWLPILNFARFPSMALIPITLLSSMFIPHYIFSFSRSKYLPSMLKAISLILLLSMGFVIIFVPLKQFTSLWTLVDGWLGQGLTQSAFHNLDRDHRIFEIISLDFILVTLFCVLTLTALGKKHYYLVIAFISLDLIIQTQGGLFFGPKSVFPSWTELQEKPRFSIISGSEYRAISNNNNQPYVDFGSYWEEMSIRQPFSNSAVDVAELKQGKRLRNLIRSYTPDWNMPFNLPIINGYTTLLPRDFAALWQISDRPGINFIDHIELSEPLLREWSVGTLIVDNQFDEGNQFAHLQLIEESKDLSIYNLPALPRIRYVSGEPVKASDYQETPNQINFNFINHQGFREIVVADRFDKNWQAKVNGSKTEIQNYQGMRLITIHPGRNSLEMAYVPREVYSGLKISVLSLVSFLVIQVILSKSKSSLKS